MLKQKLIVISLLVSIFISFTGFLNPRVAHAAIINKNGHITTDETWITGNIYVIDGTLIVDNGVTLTVQPGVIIKFGTNISKLFLSAVNVGFYAGLHSSDKPYYITPYSKSGLTIDPTSPRLRFSGLSPIS